MKFKPLGERALVRIFEREEKTVSGIVLPDTAKEKPQTAKVVEVGEGKLDNDGQRVPIEAAQGGEEWVDDLMAKVIEWRQELRATKQFALADKVRDDLQAVGVVLEDSVEGTTWRRK